MNTQQSGATNNEIKSALLEYQQNPNCWASLWVSDSSFNHWTAAQKQYFISEGIKIKAQYTK